MTDLTKQEQDNVRVALRFLRTRFGQFATLAVALRFKVETVKKSTVGADRVSASMAFRVARLAQVGIDDLLAGKYPPEGACAHCGHADGR